MSGLFSILEKLACLLVVLPGLVVALRFMRWYWEQNQELDGNR